MFSTFTEYKYEFETRTREKIAAHSYNNVDLRISDLKDNINILTVIYMSWALELNHNLLNTILLVKKGVKIILKKASQSSEIIIDEKIFGLANIIKNKYIIWLAKKSKFASINQNIALTIET